MSILRCNRCGHIEELGPDAPGTTRPCPRCNAPTPVYDAVLFVRKVLEKYFALQSELSRLRTAEDTQGTSSQTPTAAIETFDLHNSAVLSTELQHGPIQEWFQRRHVQVRTNPKAVDTTGFFDEVGTAIGKDYGVLGDVVDRIRYAYTKGYASTTIHLEGKTPQDAQRVVEFCNLLYDYSFVAKRFHLRQENLIRLVLQTAPAIRDFFNGDWLEWFAFIAMLQLVRQHRRRYSCARNLVISLQNGESYELDVFFLLDGERPLCIECKSGEFRQDIERCLRLRKRLGLDRDSFILCAVGLSPEQAQGLTSMYELSFASERDLVPRLETLFRT
jgi:hypothetical protein